MNRFYFHGTYPHTVWPISESEQFMDSINGSAEGHDASTPGVYASDRFEYGIGHYGWASDSFATGCSTGVAPSSRPSTSEEGTRGTDQRSGTRSYSQHRMSTSSGLSFSLTQALTLVMGASTTSIWTSEHARVELLLHGGCGCKLLRGSWRNGAIVDQLCPAASWCRGVRKSECSDATSQ